VTISGRDIVPLLIDEAYQFRHVVGADFEVDIDESDNPATGFAESGLECPTSPLVRFMEDVGATLELFAQPLDDIPRAVGAAVVDKDDFVFVPCLVEHG